MKYAALFRGINVGGRNIVKMADLKKLFVALGFENAQTYIQSGNVVFDAAEAAKTAMNKIDKAFSAAFGFEGAMTLRTKNEINTIVNELPFTAPEIIEAEAANSDVEHLYVFLLEEAPEQSIIDQLCAAYKGADKLCAGKREIYLLCYQSIRDSKLTLSLSKLGVPMTARNWKTINKLREMME